MWWCCCLHGSIDPSATSMHASFSVSAACMFQLLLICFHASVDSHSLLSHQASMNMFLACSYKLHYGFTDHASMILLRIHVLACYHIVLLPACICMLLTCIFTEALHLWCFIVCRFMVQSSVEVYSL